MSLGGSIRRQNGNTRQAGSGDDAGVTGIQPGNCTRSKAFLCLLESSVFCIEQCYVGLFSPATFNNHLDGQFLFGSEAAKSQEWAFTSAEGIPNPNTGVLMSKLVSICFILLWLLRTVLLTSVPREPLQLLTHVLDQPGPFTPGFLIASFPL